jgi:hypothetical protein
MATTRLTLISSVKKLFFTKYLWEGDCPACKKYTKFSFDYVRRNLLTATATSTINTLTGKVFVDLATSEEAKDKVGCSNCYHFMVICPNCQIAFSANKNDYFYKCPSCTTKLC